MFLLLVNLYEFGQFLRILLWISVPMFIIAMLVTTWLHYRRRRKTPDVALSMEGLDLSTAPEILIAAMKRMSVSPKPAGEYALASSTSSAPVSGTMPGLEGSPTLTDTGDMAERETIAPADAVDNMYKGNLWMKEKYEQYRDMADQRIEQLKEQVARVEKKYEDLLAGRVDQRIETADTRTETADTRIEIADTKIETVPMVQDESHLQQQLAAKDRQIEELQGQLQTQYLKTEELIAKLQNSSQLLLNISQELDKSAQPPLEQA
jgi:hypothetical protein